MPARSRNRELLPLILLRVCPIPGLSRGGASPSAASGPIPASGNFDPAYCKRSAPREAVNDGNLAVWPQKGVAGRAADAIGVIGKLHGAGRRPALYNVALIPIYSFSSSR